MFLQHTPLKLNYIDAVIFTEYLKLGSSHREPIDSSRAQSSVNTHKCRIKIVFYNSPNHPKLIQLGTVTIILWYFMAS